MRYKLLFTGLFSAWLSGCSSSNNLLAGRVEASVAGHNVVVTDCYRTTVPQPETDRWTPCQDADVRIQQGDLTVNGSPYGHLEPADSVLVDHGKVSVSHQSEQHK